jgi:hypothetical protein
VGKELFRFVPGDTTHVLLATVAGFTERFDCLVVYRPDRGEMTIDQLATRLGQHDQRHFGEIRALSQGEAEGASR